MRSTIGYRKKISELPPDIDALYDHGWGDVASKFKAASKELTRECVWKKSGATYFTGCDLVFHTTRLEGIKFCPFCGGIIKIYEGGQ